MMALLYLITLFSASRIDVTSAGMVVVCKNAIGYPNYFPIMYGNTETWKTSSLTAKCCELPTGEYDMHDLGRDSCPDNDEISEVMIPEDCQVTLYEHSRWRGARLTLESWHNNDENNGQSEGIVTLTGDFRHFNDKTSSLVVRCDSERWIYPHVKGAKFCADENRGNDLCCFFEAGEYNMDDLERNGCRSNGMGNDKTTGIKVDQGCQVTVYEHSGWKGESWTLEGPGWFYHDDGHFDEATISSMRITCRTFDGLWGTPEPTPAPTPGPTFPPEQSTCDTFTDFVTRCENNEFARDQCMFNVKTKGGTCAQYCGEQGSACLRAMDNKSSGEDGGLCVLYWGGHYRQSTENNGCNQQWNDQICVCKRTPIEGTCTYFGGLGDGEVCCNPGCSQCGGKNCSRATIFGIFYDLETNAAHCCHGHIREEQKYCMEHGDAPCVIRQTPSPTPETTRHPTSYPSAAPTTPAPTPTPTPEPTPHPTSNPSAAPTTPAPTSVCARYGGIGDGSVCCNSGCSKCGGKGCSRATIFGIFTDSNTSAANCCHGRIRGDQKQCKKDGDAPCLIQTSEPTTAPTSGPTPKRLYSGDSDEQESPCMGRNKRQCKSNVCAWASIPAHESVGEVHNDSDTVGEFCVDLSNFHCGLITTRKSCERSDCRWRAGRKGMEEGCMEKVECGTIKTRNLCKSSGCIWATNGKSGKYTGICHEDN